MGKKISSSVLALAALTLLSGAPTLASDVSLTRTASVPQNLVPESYPKQPAMFVVRNGDATVYLFGSAHVLSPDLKWRTSTFDEGLAKADTIWLESTILEMANPALQWAEIKTAYNDEGKHLTNLLSKEEYGRLEKVARKIGVEVMEYDHLHPWVVSDILNSAKYRKDVKVDKSNRIKTSPGVEEIIEGMRLGKPIKALENTKRHVLLFSRLTPDDEKALLMNTVKELEEKFSSTKAEMASIQTKWREGDLEGMDIEDNLPMQKETPGLFKILLIERNIEMADAIERELKKGKGTDFVAVGALHLSGSYSVVKLLEDRGYKPERLYDTAEPVAATTKNTSYYANYRAGVSAPYYLNIGLRKDVSPDKLLLRLTIPKVVHGCVEITPVEYKMRHTDEGIEIQTGGFIVNIPPHPPVDGACGGASKTTSVDVPLDLAELKSKKKQNLLMMYPGGIDAYTVSYADGVVKLDIEKEPWYFRPDEKNMSLTGL